MYDILGNSASHSCRIQGDGIGLSQTTGGLRIQNMALLAASASGSCENIMHVGQWCTLLCVHLLK